MGHVAHGDNLQEVIAAYEARDQGLTLLVFDLFQSAHDFCQL